MDVFLAKPQHFFSSHSSIDQQSKIDRMLAENSPLLACKPGSSLVKMLFRRDSVGDSMISTLSRQFGVDINIVLANVEELQGDPLGGMLAVFSGSPEAIRAALLHLKENQVSVEVIRHGTAD